MEYLDKDEVKTKTNFFLYFAVIVVNLLSFTCGTAFGWSSPINSKLSNPETSPMGYALSEDEISWLVALLSLGAAVGPFVGGFLADKIGRRRTLIVCVIPFIIAYLLLAFGANLYIFYFARFIKGASMGVLLTVVPMYVGEIAEIHNRGILGCFTIFFVTIGMFYAFVIGPYTSIQWYSISLTFGGLIFLVVFTLLIPESPCYLVLKGRHDEARRALSKLRRDSIENEFVDLIATVKESTATKGGVSEILRTRHLLKALTLGMGLMVIQQLTAISAINFYLQFIFENAGSNISPEVAAIIVGSVQIVGTFLSTLIVDRLGRRPLLLSSTIITSLSLYILGLYFYLMINGDVSAISWLPITTLMLYMLFYNVGIGPLAFAVMGEIYPPHVKSLASSVSVCCCYFCSFVAAKLFPVLVVGVGSWFAFLVFAIGNTFGAVYIWFCMPETKGKTLLEILEYFK